MDILSKVLDRGLVNERFGIHPKCDAPLITHLSFADDVLKFFDGKEESLRGLLLILEEFKGFSGFSLNRSKSSVLFDGGQANVARSIAEGLGLKRGSYLIRYLGVPLTTKKLKNQNYQPLLDNLMEKIILLDSEALVFCWTS